eukprot:Platyproteum_vivax@DN10814_c0_g1_i1.p1
MPAQTYDCYIRQPNLIDRLLYHATLASCVFRLKHVWQACKPHSFLVKIRVERYVLLHLKSWVQNFQDIGNNLFVANYLDRPAVRCDIFTKRGGTTGSFLKEIVRYTDLPQAINQNQGKKLEQIKKIKKTSSDPMYSALI